VAKSPILNTLYRESPSGAELLGGKCKTCGKIIFPQQGICPRCFSDDAMEQVPLSHKGRLYSYTVVRQGLKGIEAPYALAFVDLPEGVRLFTQLTTSDPNELKLGMDVELVLGKVATASNGEEIISYRFRPVSKQSIEGL
jgi:hypothetical protein